MKNRAGRCGQTEELVVARAALHMWEEPCISGKEGSGAVFFVGCPLGCVFCQNREIARGRADRDESSRAGKEKVSDRPADEIGHRRVGQPAAEGISHQRVEQPGKIITVDRLAEIFLELQRQKANNINLVTPTHYVPQIIEAVREARKMGLRIPIVYNTGSIETPETDGMLRGDMRIFLLTLT